MDPEASSHDLEKRVAISLLAGCGGAYAAGWLIAFVVLIGEPHLLGQYFVWSWTGGGERAIYLQVFALIAAVMGGVGGLLWALTRDAKRRQADARGT